MRLSAARSQALSFGRLIAQPLYLSQIFASAAGAGAVLLMATRLDSAQFAIFSVLNLLMGSLVGLGRNSILQPALIRFRVDKLAYVSWRLFVLSDIVGSTIFLLGSALVGVESSSALVAMWALVHAPLAQDWLRYRAMSDDKRWSVASSDAVRLMCTISLLAVPRGTGASAAQSLVEATYVLPLIVLLPRLRRVRGITSFRVYAPSAIAQSADFVVGQASSTLPLLLLSSFGPASSIAGVRVAQTVFGPINLLLSAGSSNLVADGATRGELASSLLLIRAGKRLALVMGVASTGLVGLVVLGVFALDVHPSGVTQGSLEMGVLLAGSLTIAMGWANFYNVVVRLLGRSGLVAIGRVILVICSTAGYLFGFLAGRVEGALTYGFLVSAAAYPLIFIVPANRVFARAVRGELAKEGVS